MDEMLYRACRDFVNEQSEGEWSEENIAADARAMVTFIEKVRPVRPKLDTNVTPDLVSLLDGSAKCENEAWKVAQLAATLQHPIARDGSAVWPAWQDSEKLLVARARGILAEARRQTEPKQ